MKKSVRTYTHIFVIALCVTSCSVSKFIPEDKYLLDEVRIVSDTKEVKPSLFNSYIRQNPNAKWFNMVKIPMHTYCISGVDSTKWINHFFRKIGDAPVIYDEHVALKSQNEIEKAVRNMGFMRATVHLEKKIKKNKLKLSYHIHAGHPYVIRHVAYDIDDMTVSDYVWKDSAQSMLASGMLFDVNKLDAERQRITKLLQNKGYYKFNKDFLVYQADTARNTYLVDLTLRLLPYQRRKEDIPQKHKQYNVGSVNFLADTEITSLQEGTLGGFDSLQYRGCTMYYKNKVFLRPQVLTDFNRIRPGELYSEQDVQKTYSNLGRLRALKYSNIRFHEVNKEDSAKLDVYVLLAKNKNKSVAFEIEGTNSAGDLGAAASASFQHRNVFKGSETFMLKVRGAYEAITGLGGSSQDYVNDNYMEYGVESSLNFPQFMFPFLSSDFKKRIRATSEVGVKFTSQVRPEFSRTLASASWSYKWTDRKRIQHRFDLVDVNYVYMPHASDTFRVYLDNMTKENSLLQASYEDQLVVRTGYSFTYNSAGNGMMRTPTKNSYSVRVNIEEAGNLLYAASKLVHPHPKDGGNYVLANIPFAQYVKADFDYAKNYMIDPRNSFVFHLGVGVAYPYGNSKMLPFEKRYFSGGANSVRGWSVRSLGPGVYNGGKDGKMDFINQAGDIKLDLNVEYRTHLFWKLNGAAFVDAGNIWTIREDSGQEGGLFKLNEFYKQIAVAYGLGIRFDLDYLILRFDGGMKAINPVETGKYRYPVIRPRFSRDFAFHFAVGYPF
ncbi:BamA/TamA family outer membrane protein [Phocaeicola sp.]|uniref:translocation and assembly module lipoprotein TamL n=1 Tax=Phocaeicola sp. TaxID=2773926 RepID=UPI0023D36C00|nr:BamA/TamA family outer membrane protein [Phocaeicola sp.]MDE5676574.1 outer membrane protein assembly factor [Phocaeicola sp.]